MKRSEGQKEKEAQTAGQTRRDHKQTANHGCRLRLSRSRKYQKQVQQGDQKDHQMIQRDASTARK